MESISIYSARMKEDWDRRALENARHYVHSERSSWEDSEFFRSGEINVANDIMPDMPLICGGSRSPRELKMLEIGCGVGRMTRMLSDLFGHVYAVDVSEEMLKSARLSVGNKPNVTLLLNDGASLGPLADSTIDFAFSFIVFQHIPSELVIESYFSEVFRVLKPGSIFKVQVSGGDSGDEHGRTRDTWEGVRYSPGQAEYLIKMSGFHCEYMSGADSQYYWLCLRKPYPDQ